MTERKRTALLLGIALGLLSAVAPDPALGGNETDPDGSHVVRIVAPKGLYQDHPQAAGFDPMTLLMGGGGPTRSFPALCARLTELGEHPEIHTILFDLSNPFSMNIPQLAELRRRISDLQSTGKQTVAWIENGATPHLAVASACNRILMADFGTLDFPSLGMTTLHFKDALDLFGVEASVARVGDFKGAVEPYTRSEISDHLKAHYRDMLVTMNDEVVRWVTDGRGLTTSQVRGAQADRIFTAKGALESGLVDTLVPYGRMRELLESEHPEGVTWKLPGKKYKAPPNMFEIFAELFGVQQEKAASEPSIAVLHLDGQIVDGVKAVPGSIVSGPTVKSIESLTNDENIRGVVVRINSPGGSATASEAVRQALLELSEEKPVVMSMGSLAASGGYWITCIGRPIYAEIGTITGSIGVFAMKLSFGGLFAKVGVNMTPITLDESAGAMDMSRGWTPQETARIETLIGEVYDRFLTIVAESREMDREKVDPIAGGRVWSGAQAMELGLVDSIGGSATAIAHVMREAGLDSSAPVIHRPGPVNPFAGMDLFGGGGEEEIFSIDRGVLLLLREAGFDLRGHFLRVLESIRDPRPRVMLLSPTEMIVR